VEKYWPHALTFLIIIIIIIISSNSSSSSNAESKGIYKAT